MFQSNLDLIGTGEGYSTNKRRLLEKSVFESDRYESKVGRNVRSCYRMMKVRVYRNLNKPEYFSILSMEKENKGRVVGYARSVLLENCNFVVYETARQKVLRDKVRNVHSFCEGVIADASELVQVLSGTEKVVTYNPYKMGAFYCREKGLPHLSSCNEAILQGSNVYITE